MELEYKFALDSAARGEEIAAQIESKASVLKRRDINMASIYYDTVSGSLSRSGYSLRIRQENDETVCCVKSAAKKAFPGLARREEYECPCTDIRDGIEKISAEGVPVEFIKLLREDVKVIAQMNFLRTALTLDIGGAVCEFAFDRGAFGTGDELCELELEFKEGDEEKFIRYAKAFGKAFRLHPQNFSKLARALFLAGGKAN